MVDSIGRSNGGAGVGAADQVEPRATPAVPAKPEHLRGNPTGMMADLAGIGGGAPRPGASSGTSRRVPLPSMGQEMFKSAMSALEALGGKTPEGMAAKFAANALLNHVGPLSTAGQATAALQNFAKAGTNSLINNAQNAAQMSQITDTANQNMAMSTANARLQTETQFTNTINNMVTAAWKEIAGSWKG